MMTNLFSSFDPSSWFNMTFNWMSSFLFVIMVFPMFWALPNKINILFYFLMKKLSSEFKILINSDNSSKTILFVGVFLFILCNNALGLFPYIFTSSSHLTLTMTLSLPLWISLMLYGWFNHMNHMFAHLVPQSTPNLLMPFMVLIESVSNIIRPLTLAVRLMANMVAGHLLMTLLGNQTAISSSFILCGLLLTQILLLVLETAVAFIQSYVFAVLSTLYSSEVETH